MQVGTLRLLLVKQQEINAGREYNQSLYNYHVARTELEQILNGQLMTRGLSTQPMASGISRTGMADAQGGH